MSPGSASVVHFDLRASDDVVNSVPNMLDLVLTIQIALDSLISVNEVLKLLLQAVVLIIQISHVLVKCVNLGLQFHLVLQHLIAVLLKAIDLERN